MARYRTARDKEHTDERRQDGEWATVPGKRTQTNGERNGGRGCLPFGKAGVELFIHRVRVVETLYATQREYVEGVKERREKVRARVLPVTDPAASYAKSVQCPD